MAIAFRSVKGLVDKVIQATTKAVTSKNQTFNASDDGIDGYSSFTVDITMDGNATTANVRKNKTFYNSSLTKQTGTMTEYSENTWTGTAGNNYPIPAGYHDGTTKVKCPSGDAWVTSGETIWENTASTSNFASQTITLTKAMSDYTYLRFTYRNTKTEDADSIGIIVKRTEFEKCTGNTSTLVLMFGRMDTSYHYARIVKYKNDTQVVISAAVTATSGSVTHSSTAIIIPLKIEGLK